MRGLGVEEVYTVDPFDEKKTRAVLKKAKAGKGTNVVISSSPCVVAESRSGARDSRHAMTVRLFFDANGIREDPATGSAAVCLGAYLLEHNVFDSDKVEITLSQGTSVGRPSVLHLRASSQGIEVGGNVVPIADGNWLF